MGRSVGWSLARRLDLHARRCQTPRRRTRVAPRPGAVSGRLRSVSARGLSRFDVGGERRLELGPPGRPRGPPKGPAGGRSGPPPRRGPPPRPGPGPPESSSRAAAFRAAVVVREDPQQRPDQQRCRRKRRDQEDDRERQCRHDQDGAEAAVGGIWRLFTRRGSRLRRRLSSAVWRHRRVLPEVHALADRCVRAGVPAGTGVTAASRTRTIGGCLPPDLQREDALRSSHRRERCGGARPQCHSRRRLVTCLGTFRTPGL